jgi:hypothetical protein
MPKTIDKVLLSDGHADCLGEGVSLGHWPRFTLMIKASDVTRGADVVIQIKTPADEWCEIKRVQFDHDGDHVEGLEGAFSEFRAAIENYTDGKYTVCLAGDEL